MPTSSILQSPFQILWLIKSVCYICCIHFLNSLTQIWSKVLNLQHLRQFPSFNISIEIKSTQTWSNYLLEKFRWLHLTYRNSNKDFVISETPPPRNLGDQKREIDKLLPPLNRNPYPDSVTWIAFVNQNALMCTSGWRF